jgi:hypothetical protein
MAVSTGIVVLVSGACVKNLPSCDEVLLGK